MQSQHMIRGLTRIITLPVINVRIVLSLAIAIILLQPQMTKAQEPTESSPEVIAWSQLPELPNAHGLGGPVGGVTSDKLVVAGGANFPDRPLAEGGAKKFHDAIYVLEQPDGSWRELEQRLPHPLAYSVSVSTSHGIVIVGGSDGDKNYAETYLMRWTEGRFEIISLPQLPVTTAFASGTVIGDTLYIAGGQETPDSDQALNRFFAMDLSPLDSEQGALQWRELPGWPGAPRTKAVAASLGGAFYLISGYDPQSTTDEAPLGGYLTDAYRYSPVEGWTQIKELPRPAVAAPSPAPTVGPSHFLILSGSEGNPDLLPPNDYRPGFTPSILAYHDITNTWTEMGQMPRDIEANVSPVVTTFTATWGDQIVVPSGEVRPGIRSPQILSGTPIRRQSAFSILDYTVMAAYFIGMVLVGIYFSRQGTSTEDYFLAGRRIPAWAAGISIFGSQLSAITFMAIPAKTYASNWTYLLVNAAILFVVPLVVFCYLPFYRRLNVTTAYEYLDLRFGPAVRRLGATIFVLLQLGRMGVVIFLPAIAMSAITGFDIYLCILLTGLLATIYTTLGGIEAVIWTDVLQVIVLGGAAVLSLVFLISDVGGPTTFYETASAQGKFHTFDWSWDYTLPVVWVILGGNIIMQIVPYTADQSVVQRFLTTRDEKGAARALWINAILVIPATLLFFTIGTALFVYYQQNPTQLNPTLQTDGIFPWFTTQKLPTGISGLVIAGIFAAAMSSLDTSLNSVVTVFVKDFITPIKKSLNDQSALRLARWLTLTLGVLGTLSAVILATWEIKSLWDMFTMIVGLFGGPLAGVFMLGIFTRRATSAGALIGGLAGALAVFLVQSLTQVHFFLWAACGILTCLLVGYLVSLISPATNRDLKGLTLYTLGRSAD